MISGNAKGENIAEKLTARNVLAAWHKQEGKRQERQYPTYIAAKKCVASAEGTGKKAYH